MPKILIDLFAGCGGMSLGFQNAGFEVLAAYDNWQPAIDIYSRAVLIFPTSFEMLYNLAMLESEVGDYNVAITNFEKVIAIKPDLYSVYFSLGKLYHSKKEYEKSINAYKNRIIHDDIVMGYLSGSITHNPDIELIKPTIIKTIGLSTKGTIKLHKASIVAATIKQVLLGKKNFNLKAKGKNNVKPHKTA